MPGGTIPGHDGAGPLHIAFAIGKDELAQWEQHLASRGVAIEGATSWSRGGRSITFAIRMGTCWNWRRRGCGPCISCTITAIGSLRGQLHHLRTEGLGAVIVAVQRES